MSDVSGLIDSLPKDEKIIMQRLRSLIQEAAPAIQEKISYGGCAIFLSSQENLFSVAGFFDSGKHGKASRC